MRIFKIILFILLPIISIAQEKVVLQNGEILHGRIWDINESSLVFEGRDGTFHNFSPGQLKSVYLDENHNQELIAMIKKGSITPKQKGEAKAKGRVGMGLLNLTAGFISGSTGVIPANGLQSDAMIRNEVRDDGSRDESYYMGYVAKAKRQNRRNFSLGFIGGVLTNLITHPSRTIRIF